jgi:hypothetical protein
MTDTKIGTDFDNFYGYVIIKKGINLFHKTNKSFDKINNNSFFGIRIKDINQYGSNLMIYETTRDLKLLVTFRHRFDKASSRVDKKLEEITSKLNIDYEPKDEINGIKRNKNDKTVFPKLCKKLSDCGYDGFFNLIEGKYNDYEIVIFDSNNVQLISDYQKSIRIVCNNFENYLNVGQYFNFRLPYTIDTKDKSKYDKCFEAQICNIDDELSIFSFPKVTITNIKDTTEKIIIVCNIISI